MPVSARKSSLGAARRGPQKYIRYRADDLQHGKRTGIAVGYVELDSDEFEPFEKVIGQADLRTPPKPNVPGRKKKTQKTPVVEEEEEEFDEDGEMDMEMEESEYSSLERAYTCLLRRRVKGNPNSPAAYFRNGVGTITSSVQRIGSSSRPVQRRSDVEFDRIPSPRHDSYVPLSSRKSLGHSRSSLSRSFAIQDQDEGSEPEPINYSPPPENDPEFPPVSEEDESDHDRTPVPSHKQSATRSRPSFRHISHEPQEEAQEDEEMQEEEEDEVEMHMAAKSNKAKGKAKQVEEDQGMEEEIAQGLDEVDNMPEDELEQEGEPEAEPEPQGGKSIRRGEDESIQKDERHRKKARFDTNDENAGQKKRPGRPRKNLTVLREGKLGGFVCLCDVSDSLQLCKIRTSMRTGHGVANGCAISRSNGGAVRRLSTADEIPGLPLCLPSRRYDACPKKRRYRWARSTDGNVHLVARVRA